MRTDEVILAAIDNPALTELFFSRVRKTEGCWQWTAAINSRGYGKMTLPPKRGYWVAVGAHRVSWMFANRRSPNGLHILHTCDNKWCVNPEHLYPGTDADNHRDMAERGLVLSGERNPRAKLSMAKAAEIRRLYAAGLTQEGLASMFGVKQAAISQVIRMKRWI